MKLFRDDNTEGYSQQQLDALNEEWEKIADELYAVDDEERDFRAKVFSDEASRRQQLNQSQVRAGSSLTTAKKKEIA